MTEPKYISRWRNTRKTHADDWREVESTLEGARNHIKYWGGETNRLYVSDIQVLKDGEIIFSITRDGNKAFEVNQLVINDEPLAPPKVEVKRSVLEI